MPELKQDGILRAGLFAAFTVATPIAARDLERLSVGWPVPIWQIVVEIVATTILGLCVLVALFAPAESDDDGDNADPDPVPTPASLEEMWRR